MSGNDSDRTPDGLDPVVRRLREERPQLEALELDRMKTRLRNRRGSQTTKGAGVRGRIVVAVLSLGLLAAGAGGVAAAGGSGGSGASSASAQYKPGKCSKGFHYNGKIRKCVRNKPPTCPKGTHWNKKDGACVTNKKPHKRKPNNKCGKKSRYSKKIKKCVAKKPPKCPKGYHFIKRHGKWVCYNPKKHSTIQVSQGP